MKYKIDYFTKKECKKIIDLHKTYKHFGFKYLNGNFKYL